MPRISPEARATATAQRSGKLEPTPHLSPAEKTAWRAIVEATAAGHLSERDRPLVESYVSLTVAQRKLHKHIAKFTASQLLDDSVGGKAMAKVSEVGKTLAAISNRLKIAPLGGNAAAHKAGQRNETPSAPSLLGGKMRIVK